MNEPITLKRPKPGDGEEELMRMQEEFLKSRQEPSAKVVNLRAQYKQSKEDAKLPERKATPVTGQPSGRIISKFAERKALKQQEKLSTSQSSGPMINPKIAEQVLNKDGEIKTEADSVQGLPIDFSNIIIGNIVERKPSRMNTVGDNVSKLDTCKKGFPEVFHVDLQSTGSGSLFMQAILKESDQSESHGYTVEKVSAPSVPLIQDSVKREIHQSNVEKLSRMSTEEILEAKSQLESTLSPDILKFLKARKNNATKFHKPDIQAKKEKEESPNMETNHDKEDIVDKSKPEYTKKCIDKEEKATKPLEDVVVKMECDVHPIEKETPIGELVEQASVKGWMHMDTIEPEKLEWMKDVQPKSEDPRAEEPYNARFDFNGVLLPFRDDTLSVDKGLHHHGEEPERPGYTLQELLQLGRSSTQQQRCTALTTLANILEKSRNGWYDNVLQPAPLVALNEKNILLFLRFSLDDKSLAVITNTLQALRAFLCSEADEVCLDRLYGWPYTDGKFVEPELPAPKHDVSDTNNLKDHELAQLDTVAAAVRSDIVFRIRYILSEMHPPPVGVNAALDILTRLARQSSTRALNIACSPHLLETVVRNFIPLSTGRRVIEDGVGDAYGVPNANAIKFCRVLVTYAGKPVAERLNNLKIVQTLFEYATKETMGIGIRVAIESLRLWKLMLSHDVARDSVCGIHNTLGSQLQLLLTKHDLESSSELACEHAGALIDVCVYEMSLRSTVVALLTKWSTQLGSVSSPTWGQTKLVAKTLVAVGDIRPFRWSWATKNNIFTNLCSTSNLLSGCTVATERDPPTLPSLGVLTEEGQLQPAVSVNSCIPFLATWINIFSSSFDTRTLEAVLANPDFVKYVRRLSSNDWSLESSWYTRAELFLATGIVRAGDRLGSVANEYVNEAILRIAVKLISALPGDAFGTVREMLRIVLSNERVTIKKLSKDLHSLKLEMRTGGVDQLLKLPENLSSIYERYVSTNGSWDQAAMPKDWIYLPLVAAYADAKNKVKWNEEDTTKIVVLLSLELNMPELSQSLSPSLRFSRLILIYLCDTIYLNEDVSLLLNEVMTSLIKKCHKRFDFASDLPGLTSFVDLFTSLCESFCANSYGNDGFASTLLVPLAQRHNVHYRKLLWSEHAGALRYLRLSSEKLVVPMSEYLYPIEEDASLIESYITALVRGTVQLAWCPLMHKIAMHHSAMYLKRDDKLAAKMRTKIGRLRDGALSNALLNYNPTEM